LTQVRLGVSRRTRFVIWLAAFALLAIVAPHLPTAWGIGLAIGLFAAGALLPAKDCTVRPSADERSR
jgi:hypothetical protein